jgi:hypothetical protein
MPLYDYECPHHHRFERFSSIAGREDPVACEGKGNQLVMDDVLVARYADGTEPLPADLFWEELPVIDGASGEQADTGKILIRRVPCALQAHMVIAHNNPGGAIFHNSAANRDAAREGRYDPANPSRRFVTKGRGWRK